MSRESNSRITEFQPLDNAHRHVSLAILLYSFQVMTRSPDHYDLYLDSHHKVTVVGSMKVDFIVPGLGAIHGDVFRICALFLEISNPRPSASSRRSFQLALIACACVCLCVYRWQS